MSDLIRRGMRRDITPADPSAALTFNFAAALPGRASSRHTMRAYFRWVDTYLVDMAGFQPTTGEQRVIRMQALPIKTLISIISAAQLRAWLGMLIQRGHGKQGIEQARASIVTLTDLLAEAEWIEDYAAAALARVKPPRAESGQRTGRWLSLDEIHQLIHAGEMIATNDAQVLRNRVVLTTLCTMALRREELSVARWGDLSKQNNRAVLRVHGKGRKVAMVDVPRPVLSALQAWHNALPDEPNPQSRIVRRIWKGGHIAKQGLTPDGIWWLVDACADAAGLGAVAPHDLRRSVAGALHESGVPVDKISRLLRHSNIAITERYLNRLPKRNEGGVLMSNLLGFEDWPGIE